MSENSPMNSNPTVSSSTNGKSAVPVGPLADQFKALESLQEIDLKIDQLNKKRLELPKLLGGMDEQLKKMEADRLEKNKTVTEIEKNLRQAVAAIELNQDRHQRSKTRLESVTNSQEFQAVSKEIEQLQKMTAQLEEQKKKFETEMAAIQGQLTETQGKFDSIQHERNSKAVDVGSEQGTIDSQIATLQTERQVFAVKVDARIRNVYDRVRVARAGLGVVPAIGGRCRGCNMMLPPQLYNEVQKSLQPQSCPTCNRLLYVPGEKSGA